MISFDATTPTGQPSGTTSTSSGGSSSDSSSLGLGTGLDGNSFITLLTAQLQAQDPTNPLDPNQFVTELVQFNMLQELINIQQLLTPSGSTTSTTPSDATSQQNSQS